MSATGLRQLILAQSFSSSCEFGRTYAQSWLPTASLYISLHLSAPPVQLDTSGKSRRWLMSLLACHLEKRSCLANAQGVWTACPQSQCLERGDTLSMLFFMAAAWRTRHELNLSGQFGMVRRIGPSAAPPHLPIHPRSSSCNNSNLRSALALASMPTAEATKDLKSDAISDMSCAWR